MKWTAARDCKLASEDTSICALQKLLLTAGSLQLTSSLLVLELLLDLLEFKPSETQTLSWRQSGATRGESSYEQAGGISASSKRLPRLFPAGLHSTLDSETGVLL